MESRSLVPPNALSSILFGTSDPISDAFSLWGIRALLCAGTLACVGLGISTIHFYTRYKHEAQTAGRLKSELRSQIEVTNADERTLQAQVADLSKTLEKTKIALALASRPSVSTTLPTPKIQP